MGRMCIIKRVNKILISNIFFVKNNVLSLKKMIETRVPILRI